MRYFITTVKWTGDPINATEMYLVKAESGPEACAMSRNMAGAGCHKMREHIETDWIDLDLVKENPLRLAVL